MADFVLYGAPGWGSVLVEATLTWCGLPFRFEDVDGFDAPGPERDRLLALNPLAQVPTLVLPDGQVMTESVAIALWLAAEHPDARLAPPPGSAELPQFLRRMVWLVAAVYPTFTFADYPERWSPGDADGLRERVVEHRKALWAQLESALDPRPWATGETFTALDIFICAMTRWGPRRAWFETECPKLFALARKVDEIEQLEPVWARNFPEP